jgi:hypothetical protein
LLFIFPDAALTLRALGLSGRLIGTHAPAGPP